MIFQRRAWREDNIREADCCTGSGMRHKIGSSLCMEHWMNDEVGRRASRLERQDKGKLRKT